MKKNYVIDGCAFCENEFSGLSEEVLNSKMDAFLLTVPGQMEGFHECIIEIGKIYNLTDELNENLTIVKTLDELVDCKNKNKKGIILAFQNPHPIENSIDKLRIFYELGIRVIQLTYNKMNYLGTGCLETLDNGLTDFGKKMVIELNRLGIVIDLSHCSNHTAIDTLKLSEKPVVFSHAGSKYLTDNPRNKTDEELLLLKENGGVIGLSPWGPLCWKKEQRKQPTLDDFLDHVDYVVNLIGIDHVGFGGDSTLDNNEDDKGIKEQSELYGAVVEEYNQYVGIKPEDRHAIGVKGVWQIDNVIEGMKKRGYSEVEIAKFTGGNFLRVFEQVWK
jgi:membrane dipeptidase